MTATIQRLTRDQVAEHWDAIEPILSRVSDAILTDKTTDDIHALVMGGERHLWLVLDPSHESPIRGVFTTAMLLTPSAKIMQVEDLAGDDIAEWLHLLPELEHYAAEAGATLAHIEGRLGWQRLLASHGYRPVRVVLQKEI